MRTYLYDYETYKQQEELNNLKDALKLIQGLQRKFVTHNPNQWRVEVYYGDGNVNMSIYTNRITDSAYFSVKTREAALAAVDDIARLLATCDKPLPEHGREAYSTDEGHQVLVILDNCYCIGELLYDREVRLPNGTIIKLYLSKYYLLE